MIDKGPVLLDIADGIARMRLNRPDAANGMSAELLSALCNAIMVCHGQADLRVLLLSGEGTNFCAGGDIRAFASKGEKLPDYIRQATAYLQNAVTGLLRLEATVITSVQAAVASASSAPPISLLPANLPSSSPARRGSRWRRTPGCPLRCRAWSGCAGRCRSC
jgi:enoyl-CoA hydratase/carnithine racemase